MVEEGIVPGGHGVINARLQVSPPTQCADDPPADRLEDRGNVRIAGRLALDRPGLETRLGAIEVDALVLSKNVTPNATGYLDRLLQAETEEIRTRFLFYTAFSCYFVDGNSYAFTGPDENITNWNIERQQPPAKARGSMVTSRKPVPHADGLLHPLRR